MTDDAGEFYMSLPTASAVTKIYKSLRGERDAKLINAKFINAVTPDLAPLVPMGR